MAREAPSCQGQFAFPSQKLDCCNGPRELCTSSVFQNHQVAPISSTGISMYASLDDITS